MRLRRVRLLFAVVGVAESALIPFLAIVLRDGGLSAAEIGVVLALGSLTAVVATPVWGYLADRVLGAERALAAASLAAALLAVPLVFVDGFAALAVCLVAVTAARSPTATLADAIALERLGAGARGEYGRVRLWQSLGWAAGAAGFGLALEYGALELLPLLYAAAIAALLVAVRIVGPRAAVLRSRPDRGTRRAMARRLAPFLGSLLLLFAAYSATFSFVTVRIDDLGGGLFVIGVAAAVQALAEIPVMRANPWLGARFDHRVLYGLGAVVLAAAFGGWALLDDALTIALVKLVAGVGFALSYVASVTIVDDLVPHTLRGTGQGLARAVCFGLAPVLGSLGGGAVYEVAGARVLFAACAAAALAAGAGIAVSALRRDREPRVQAPSAPVT